MSFVNYSPWQDAAQYGAGLGNTLGQVLLSIPLKRAEFERDRNRDRLNDNVQNAHARYFDSLTAAMPDKEQALKDREQERMLHNIAIEDYLKAKATNLAADTTSKVGMRDANMERIKTNTSLAPSLADSLIKARNALAGLQDMRLQLAPENAQTARLGANANAALSGVNPLPQIQLPQLPIQDPMAHAVQSGMGLALPPPPPGMPMTPAGANATTRMMSIPQPSPRIRIQSKSTGRTGWASPQEIAADPDLQPLQ